MLKINNETIHLIKLSEGCYLKAHTHVNGLLAIGIGLLKYPQEVKIKNRIVLKNDTIKKEDELISTDQAEHLLRISLDILTLKLEQLLTELPRNSFIFGSLLSFVYNIGLDAFKQSSLLTRWNNKENQKLIIQEEFPKWNKLAGIKLDNLDKIRNIQIRFSQLNPLKQYSQEELKNLNNI